MSLDGGHAMVRAFARSIALPTLLVGQFNQHRLMIGCGGFAVYFDTTNPAGDIRRDEDEVATVRAVFPLRAIMNAAGRIVRHARMADRPCVSIVQSRPE